ncbi:hypothetical protein MNBD_GAMMA05-668 [hydrothermal vent metagenome]|uniref:Uncharacterized protein n=1 Tax=hydrothermal vent metagenome TaxID=652676 RepID=A0A3B0WIK9_9ZZZZ
MSSETKCLNHLIVLQFNRFLCGGLLTLLLSACSGGSGGSDNDPAKVNASQSKDLIIASALYFDKRTPEGFYQEQSVSDDYYVTNHVKNIDLLPLANRSGLPIFELTSDDATEAMNWSEQAAILQPTYKQLVDVTETALYRQFTRMDPAAPEFIYLQRILKANVLDRNGVDDTYKGRITLPSMSAEDVKLIIEYLWTFTIDNNFGTAVLSSNTDETNNEFVHVMQQAKLNLSFNDSCDSIEIYEVSYSVAKASGFINRTEVLTRVMSAKRTGASLEICST